MGDLPDTAAKSSPCALPEVCLKAGLPSDLVLDAEHSRGAWIDMERRKRPRQYADRCMAFNFRPPHRSRYVVGQAMEVVGRQEIR